MGGESLLEIFKGVQAVAPLGQGFADRSAATYNAGIFRKQAGQARQAAAYDESAQRRAGAQVIAQQTANALADGGAGGSSIDVIRQNDINLRLDALMTRARGEAEAEAFRSRAKMAEHEGDRALYSGLQGTGAQLLQNEFERRARSRSYLTVND